MHHVLGTLCERQAGPDVVLWQFCVAAGLVLDCEVNFVDNAEVGETSNCTQAFRSSEQNR